MMHKDRLDALTALLLEHQYDAFLLRHHLILNICVG